MITITEHARAMATKDTQIVSLEKSLGSTQGEAASLRARVQGLERAVDAAHARSKSRIFAVALITNHRGEVLLVHNRNRNGWELVGGSVEPDEHPRDAAMREPAEEAGVDAWVEGLPCAVLCVPTGVALVYRGRAGGNPRAGDDADDARWFANDTIPWDDLSKVGSASIVRQWAEDRDAEAEPVEPRPVYYCCPGDGGPWPCMGSGISTQERACPNCGQWCVPYPSASNLAAAERPRIGDPIVRRPR